MGNGNGGMWDAMDLLQIVSLMLGYVNLMENRQQSAQNDVNAANDKQAKHLLDEIGKRLYRQDAMLQQILEVINRENPAREE